MQPLFSYAGLVQLQDELKRGSLPCSELSARFLILHLWHRHQVQCFSGARPFPNSAPLDDHALRWMREQGFVLRARQAERMQRLPLPTVGHLFAHCYFRGVALDSHEGLLGWMEGRYPLTLRTHIPTPDEMFTMQCRGGRYVTLLLNPEEQFQRIGRHTDACAFLLHDLEHAHKFYADPALHAGQVRFFNKLKSALNNLNLWLEDPLFKNALDYLKSDMNSHPVHLMKYLKAIVLAAEIRRSGRREPDLEPFWRDIFQQWEMPEPILTSALNLNQPAAEQLSDHIFIRDFFVNTLKKFNLPISHEQS